MNAPTEIKSPFERLSKVNVNEHVEKKNGLSYLSWAWAWAELMKADHTATVEYHAPTEFGNKTFMVSCTVTAFGINRTMSLPVMDHRNKAIADPDAFAFNTAMQRCLVKAIAMHGLGLYIYAGEDLPEESKEDRDAADAKLIRETHEILKVAASFGNEALTAAIKENKDGAAKLTTHQKTELRALATKSEQKETVTA
jgi:hypothetical protein